MVLCVTMRPADAHAARRSPRGQRAPCVLPRPLPAPAQRPGHPSARPCLLVRLRPNRGICNQQSQILPMNDGLWLFCDFFINPVWKRFSNIFFSLLSGKEKLKWVFFAVF